MKKTINFYEFADTMESVRPHNFSRKGLTALFDYFEEYEDSTETELEFDPIGICCEFSEDSLQNILERYDLETLEDLEAYTTVIYIDGKDPELEDDIIISDY